MQLFEIKKDDLCNPVMSLSAQQRPIFNWLVAFSYMLAPDDAEMQEKIYHFRVLQYALGRSDRVGKFFSKAKSREMIPKIREALYAQEWIRNEILTRRKYARRIGEIARFLRAMVLLEEPEPSLNKAYYLSKIGFKRRDSKQDGKKYSFSTRMYDKKLKEFNSALHLCAAYSQISPDNSRIEVPKSQRIQYFFAKTNSFRAFVGPFEYSRQGRNERDRHSLVTGELYVVPEGFSCVETSIDFETAQFLEKVKRCLKGFSYDWGEKPL